MKKGNHIPEQEFLIKTDIYIDPDGTVTICDLPGFLVPLVVSLSGLTCKNEGEPKNEQDRLLFEK